MAQTINITHPNYRNAGIIDYRSLADLERDAERFHWRVENIGGEMTMIVVAYNRNGHPTARIVQSCL
jgi:hypothetical protein